MSEREATALLDRLAEQLPPTIPPTAAIIRGGRARRRRQRVVRAVGSSLAVAAVVGLGSVAWPSDPVTDLPVASNDLPEPEPGMHWEGSGGALVAVPDNGTVSVIPRPFDRDDNPRWRIPDSLSDGKPVDTVTRGPRCAGTGATTRCRSTMAIPGLHIALVVDATGANAESMTLEVLDSLTYATPAQTAELP